MTITRGHTRLPTAEKALSLGPEELHDVLVAAARLEYRDADFLSAADGRLAAASEEWPLEQHIAVVQCLAKFQWRSAASLRASQSLTRRASELRGQTPAEQAQLLCSLARLDCRGRGPLSACKGIAASALHRVEEFEASDLARAVAGLCRLGAMDDAWRLYSRVQRVAPGAAGSPEVRATLLTASERSGNVERTFAILAHLSIFPRVARSPTWRVALASAAVMTTWRAVGSEAAAEVRRRLDDVGARKSAVAAALGQRLDDLISAAAAGPQNSARGFSPRESASLDALGDALHAGPKDKTADRRKEFEMLRHIAGNAFPWDALGVLGVTEVFASQRAYMKLAGGVKRRLLERIAKESPPGVVVELGTYVGYSSSAIALARGGHSIGPAGRGEVVSAEQPPSVLTVELDPVNAVVARCYVALAGLAAEVEVWAGSSADAAHYVRQRFGARSVAMVFMDHRGSIFHEDLLSFEALDLLADDARVVCDNVLKPGAPRLLWHLTQSPSYDCEIVELPEFGLGHQALEDWMATARYKIPPDGASADSDTHAQASTGPPPCPAAIAELANSCDEMRRQSILPGGVDVDEWAVHAKVTKKSLLRLGITAIVTDGEWASTSPNERAGPR